MPSWYPDASVNAIDIQYTLKFNVNLASPLNSLLFSKNPVVRLIWPLHISFKTYNNRAYQTNISLSCAYASLPFPKTPYQLLQCYLCNTNVGPCVFSCRAFNMMKSRAAGAQVRKVHAVLAALSICMCPQSQLAAVSLQVEEIGREDGPCLITLLGSL